MQRLTSTTSLLALGCALSFGLLTSSPVTAQGGPPSEPPGQGGGGPGGGGGGGGGGGPGGGGGKPTNPSGKGDLYADLIMLYRTVDGLPILDVNGCLQPVTPGDLSADPNFKRVENPVNGETVSLIPLVGSTGEEEEECDVLVTQDTDYSVFLREVEFGRLAVARSPEKVLDQQLREVLAVLSDATISLDAAGRLVADEVEIDSPLQNLAIHRELQNFGVLTSLDQTEIVLPPPPVNGYGFLDHAAAALGAAADKFGEVTPDLIVYQNAILGIPSDTEVLPTITGGVLGPDGVEGVPGDLYVNYGPIDLDEPELVIDYQYDRAAKYPGCVEGLFVIDGVGQPFSGSLMYFVFDNEPFSAGNVHGFAQAADDSRAVIAFVHDNIVTNVDSVGERLEDCADPVIDPR